MDREETSAATREYIQSLDRDLIEFVVAQLVDRNFADPSSLPLALQDKIDRAFGTVIASRTVELRKLLESASGGLTDANRDLSDKIARLEAAIARVPEQVRIVDGARSEMPGEGAATTSRLGQPTSLAKPGDRGFSSPGTANTGAPEGADQLSDRAGTGTGYPATSEDQTASASKSGYPAAGTRRSRAADGGSPSGANAADGNGGFLDKFSLSTWRAIALVLALALLGLGYFAWTQFTDGSAQQTRIAELEQANAELQKDPYIEACKLIENQKAPIAATLKDIQEITKRDGFGDIVAQVNNQNANGLQAQALGVLVSTEKQLSQFLSEEDSEILKQCKPSPEQTK